MAPEWKTPWRRWSEKVGDPDANGCWPWLAYRDSHGYGYFMQRVDKCISAHRYGYLMLVGDVPEGLVLDHLCRNPWCCNPEHLEPVTQAENVRRGDGGKYNAAKTHCPQGHPYDEENTYLNPQGNRECRACHLVAARRYRERKRAA